MPRDGSNIYHLPVGTTAVTDTSIESSKYNNFTADIEQDLNTVRPIVAGGTGSSTAAGALANMGGEQAGQVVTNYSSNVFVAGSFYSASTATDAPVSGHAFAGICYAADASNMFIEARDRDDTTQPGRIWVRQMKAGVWSAWRTDPDPGAYVDTAGDTMTGLLILSGDPAVALGAATKQMVDAKLPLAGGTMTGAITLAADPAANLQPATKQYVDGKVVGPATVAPLMDGTAAVGTSGLYARQDHVHPTDTTRMSTAGGQTITGGFNVTPNNLGNITSFTLNPLAGNYQYGTNHGAATWTAPASDCGIDVLVTNDATAGTITFAGFTIAAFVGDALDTVNGHKFIISIRRINGTSTYTIKALQ